MGSVFPVNQLFNMLKCKESKISCTIIFDELYVMVTNFPFKASSGDCDAAPYVVNPSCWIPTRTERLPRMSACSF